MAKRWLRSSGIAAIACVMVIAAAGAKTKIVESQGSERPPEAPPRKILVLVISSDSISRAGVEDVIAGELSLRGATAVASHKPFPELPQDRASFEAKLVSEGFDAVTVSRLVGKADKVEWKPETTSFTPDYMGMDMWGGYWYTYKAVLLPGYLAKETRVRVRTDLWRTSGANGRLVWSGTSETLDPVTVPQAAHQVGTAVANALVRAKLI